MKEKLGVHRMSLRSPAPRVENLGEQNGAEVCEGAGPSADEEMCVECPALDFEREAEMAAAKAIAKNMNVNLASPAPQQVSIHTYTCNTAHGTAKAALSHTICLEIPFAPWFLGGTRERELPPSRP